MLPDCFISQISISLVIQYQAFIVIDMYVLLDIECFNKNSNLYILNLDSCNASVSRCKNIVASHYRLKELRCNARNLLYMSILKSAIPGAIHGSTGER